MDCLTKRGGWQWLVAAALLAWALVVGAQTHEVTTATPLRATPSLNSMVLRQLAPGAALQAVQTQGSWLKVQVGESQGWVRLGHVRASAAKAPEPGGGNALASLFTGTSTQPTATTGTRGLTQEQLANAQPAPQEVQRLENYVITAREAERFARAGNLGAVKVSDYDGAAQ